MTWFNYCCGDTWLLFLSIRKSFWWCVVRKEKVHAFLYLRNVGDMHTVWADPPRPKTQRRG